MLNTTYTIFSIILLHRLEYQGVHTKKASHQAKQYKRQRAPDLNPIANLWGILTQWVYKDNWQFDVVKELITALHNY